MLIYLSYPLVELLFERGAFDSTDTYLVAHVQIYYLLQLPFYMLAIMGTRLMSALSLNQVLLKIAGINLIVNIVGNLILMQYMGL